MIEVYTDGGSRNNPGNGAWAYVVVEDDKVIFSKSYAFKKATNNMMELYAILEAAKYLELHRIDNAIIYSDSQYAVNVINTWYWNWVDTNKLKGKKNLNIIREIFLFLKGNRELKWVKGHASNKYNNLADRLVNEAMDNL